MPRASEYLAELIDYVSGASRLSPPQIDALARKMGLIEDLPPAGVDLVRARLRVMMRKWPNFVTHFEWRHGDQALRDFLDGGSLTLDQVNFLARAFFGEEVSVDPETAELRRPPKVVTSPGVPPGPWTGGSNVAGINAMAVQNLRTRLKALEVLGVMSFTAAPSDIDVVRNAAELRSQSMFSAQALAANAGIGVGALEKFLQGIPFGDSPRWKSSSRFCFRIVRDGAPRRKA